MEEWDEAIGEGKSERRVWLVEDTEKERVETTRELQRSEGERGKKMERIEERMGFCGGWM